MKGALYIAAVALCAGCDLLDPHDCSTMLVPGIVVTVQDSATGADVRGPLVVLARDGGYADTARIFNPYGAAPDSMDFNPYQLAFDRAGTYEVSVLARGFQGWSQSGVRVTKRECHVNTASLTALLRRTQP